MMTSPLLVPVPVVLFDVDGVIAPSGGEPSYDGEVVWADLPPGRMHFPVVVLDWLRSLEGRAQVVWLTSWQDHAPLYLAPATGLPAWTYHARRDAPRWPQCTATDWWKEAIVRAYLEAGHSVVWCDDDIAFRANEIALDAEFGDQLFAVSPRPGTGLSFEERAAIDEWLAQKTTGSSGPLSETNPH